MKKWFFEKCLPIYFRFKPTWYWIALWSAPVRFKGKWRVNKKWVPVERNDTDWQALRITIRKGCAHSKLVRVLKKGVI